MFYVFLWIILWWRIWYCFIYNPLYYLENPLDILKIWEWGMSFHWGVLWTIIAILLYNKEKFLENIWKIALVAPIWLWLGRIWNYINKELLGFEYYWPLAVEIWEKSYFPSPLLEAFLEGLILFFILFLVWKNTKNIKIIWPLFLIWYSFFRFLIEFIRLPDPQLWYLALGLTMGQYLSIIMLTIWIILFRKIQK